MVRLKVDEHLSCKVVTMFQFQYGAIKSVNITVTFFAELRFNSNMVRLKDTLKRRSFIADCCFNSNMVRLKAFLILILLNNNSRFNSNMVRLKERRNGVSRNS